MRDLVQFLRATGWRRDEGRLLPWAAVDREAGTIRLEDARSKSGKPRVFPFGLALACGTDTVVTSVPPPPEVVAATLAANPNNVLRAVVRARVRFADSVAVR